jgi:gamma-glutamylcyclotransferase (GGCT)/AIG2-like uncharacterized protein YtfP
LRFIAYVSQVIRTRRHANGCFSGSFFVSGFAEKSRFFDRSNEEERTSMREGETVLDDKVFVYGTLKRGLGNHRIVSRHVRSVRNACMRGWMYNLGYYPAVVSGSGIVHGQVLELENPEKAFRAMDILEGYIESGHPRNLYDRMKTTVLLDSGHTEEVFVYLYPDRNKDELSTGSGFMPEGEWYGESGQERAKRKRLFFANEISKLPSPFAETLSQSVKVGQAEWNGALGALYLMEESATALPETHEHREIDMEVNIDGLRLPCITYVWK